jgi:hypothetical protein
VSPFEDIRYGEICRTICHGHGTAQCAALCLQHSSLRTKDGGCPHATEIWGKHVPAVQWYLRGLTKAQRRSK